MAKAVVPEQQPSAGVTHVIHAFDVLCNQLSGLPSLPQPGFEDAVCPLFVSWHKSSRLDGDYRLRGCIGTLEPRPLHSAVRDYALTSALQDRRFNPIRAAELPYLRCTVSVLSNFEHAEGWEDWEVGTHGLIIEFMDPQTGGRRTATFLPDVAAHEGWDKQQTMDHLIRKAGFLGPAVMVRNALRITRYQSTTYSLTYEEYSKLKDSAHAGKGAPCQQTLITVAAAK